MVRPFGAQTTLAAAGERADEHRGLGVQRQPQGRGLRRRLLMHFLEVVEDGVGLLHFFWGRHLATLRRRKPRAFSLAPIV
jgi:GNAT superfamily N-acetyltransferase